jgi:hypothetical protein
LLTCMQCSNAERKLALVRYYAGTCISEPVVMVKFNEFTMQRLLSTCLSFSRQVGLCYRSENNSWNCFDSTSHVRLSLHPFVGIGINWLGGDPDHLGTVS